MAITATGRTSEQKWARNETKKSGPIHQRPAWHISLRIRKIKTEKLGVTVQRLTPKLRRQKVHCYVIK